MEKQTKRTIMPQSLEDFKMKLRGAKRSANVRRVEEFLRLEPGSFDHIPHYAREAALSAIEDVRKLESQQAFRPGIYYIVLSDLSRATRTSATLGKDLNTMGLKNSW